MNKKILIVAAVAVVVVAAAALFYQNTQPVVKGLVETGDAFAPYRYALPGESPVGYEVNGELKSIEEVEGR